MRAGRITNAMREPSSPQIAVFPTELGWTAIAGHAEVLRQLSFGHADPSAARRGLADEFQACEPRDTWFPRLVSRLKDYAMGKPVSFDDIELAIDDYSPFQRRVLERCLRIPYGQTMTYGELAAAVGRPRAARAVGTTMASNRIALVIPCHRVVRAGGWVGSYSAGEGTRLKLRLLEMESAAERGDRPKKKYRALAAIAG